MLKPRLTYCLFPPQSLVRVLVLSLYFPSKLGNESLRIALGLRIPIVFEHCGSKVDVFGTHGLSCRGSGDRIP